jgi:hypothetical protein
MSYQTNYLEKAASAFASYFEQLAIRADVAAAQMGALQKTLDAPPMKRVLDKLRGLERYQRRYARGARKL